MDSPDFFSRFNGTLLTVQTRYNLDNLHDALILWFAENCLYMDPDDVKERIVPDMHAEGIDAILVDQRNFELTFVQAKTVKNFEDVTKVFPENDVKLTLQGARFLLAGDYEGKITPEIENLLREYHELDNTGDYKTRIIFLAMKAKPIDDKFIQDFKEDFRNISVDFFDFEKLHELYETEYLVIRARPPEKISFTVINTILRKDNPYKARVFTCSAKELAKIYNDYKEKIFQTNVRYFLGTRSSVDINSQILRTATDDKVSPNFWYYNNGITIVCDQIQESQSGKLINLKNAQIINGAQTTSVLFEVLQKGTLKDDVEVLIKAIESRDKPFVENVTLYTNSQNAIRLRDLCSNDLVQEKIKKLVWDNYGYYYERKRGEFDSEFPTIDAKKKALGNEYRRKFISNENAAQAYLAFYLERPAQAKAETIRIFMKEQAGFYSQIFSEKDENLADKLFLSWRLLKYVEEQKGIYRNQYTKARKMQEGPERDKIYRYDFLLHSEYFILNLLSAFLMDRGYKPNGPRNELIEMTKLLNEKSNELQSMYEIIRETMAEYMQVIKSQPGYYHNKFFKSEKSISLVRNHFNEKYRFVTFVS